MYAHIFQVWGDKRETGQGGSWTINCGGVLQNDMMNQNQRTIENLSNITTLISLIAFISLIYKEINDIYFNKSVS